MNYYVVYILESLKDRSWYIGYITSLKNRVRDHNYGKNTSIRSKRPWNLIYAELYRDKFDALGREKFLKSGSGIKFIKSQLTHYLSRTSCNEDIEKDHQRQIL